MAPLPWARFPSGLRLRSGDLDGIIDRYGLDTTVRRAVQCPCLDAETRRADPTCANCAGWGLRYPPGLGLTLKVQWTGNRQRHVGKEAGSVEPGDYTVSWPSSQPLGYGDMLVHPVEEAVADDALQRGSTAPNGDSLELLRFRFATAIEDVRDEVRTYTQGVDWALVGPESRQFSWLGGGVSPAAGTMYVVRYRYRAEYVIAPNMPQVRHDAERLPFKAAVLRFDPVSMQAGRSLGESAA